MMNESLFGYKIICVINSILFITVNNDNYSKSDYAMAYSQAIIIIHKQLLLFTTIIIIIHKQNFKTSLLK